MLTNYFKRYNKIIVFLLILFGGLILTSCDKKIELTYESFSIENAEVGKDYHVSLATAKGAEGIIYKVVDGTLPEGLTLSSDGLLTGIATKEELNVEFTVEASKNDVKVTADFIINVIQEQVGETELFKFEAELVNLDDKMGAGPSNAAPGITMIRKDTKASNGHYIADTYRENLSFEFVITADDEGSALLVVALGSDLGAIKINPDVFEISINGEVISYKEFRLKDSSGALNKNFTEHAIGTINLVAGENEVKLMIKENTYINGSTGGPLIDYISLQSTAKLSWEPRLDNLES